MLQMKKMPNEDEFLKETPSSSKRSPSEREVRTHWSRVARLPTKVELLDRRKKVEALVFTFKCEVRSLGLDAIMCARAYTLGN